MLPAPSAGRARAARVTRVARVPRPGTRRLRGLLAAAAVSWLLATSGCRAIVENDSAAWGGNGDRWDSGGLRGERDVVPSEPGGGVAEGAPWIDAVAVGVGSQLAMWPDDAPDGYHTFTTYTSVLAIELYTPDDIESELLVPDDRPYAGWAYAGVVRVDTQLDPDPQRRRDVEDEVELDLGLVGPAVGAEWIQRLLHDVVGGKDPKGWSHQLENEPGFVLRGRRTRRVGYVAGGAPDALELDLLTRVEGAVGNVDTHGLVGGGVRAGWNLPRSVSIAAGDKSRLLPGAPQRPMSLYVHADVDARLVLRNMFLDGNAIHGSHRIDKEEFVHELRVGVAWEFGDVRLGYTWARRSEEFEGQPEAQALGTYVLSWTPR